MAAKKSKSKPKKKSVDRLALLVIDVDKISDKKKTMTLRGGDLLAATTIGSSQLRRIQKSLTEALTYNPFMASAPRRHSMHQRIDLEALDRLLRVLCGDTIDPEKLPRYTMRRRRAKSERRKCQRCGSTTARLYESEVGYICDDFEACRKRVQRGRS